MKKTMLFGIAVVLIAVIGVTIAACGGGGGGGGKAKLSGTYANEDLEGWTITFSGKKVTTELMGEKEEGTFEINGDEITMTSSDGDKFIMREDKMTLTFIKKK